MESPPALAEVAATFANRLTQRFRPGCQLVLAGPPPPAVGRIAVHPAQAKEDVVLVKLGIRSRSTRARDKAPASHAGHSGLCWAFDDSLRRTGVRFREYVDDALDAGFREGRV